ncbi:MAG: sulfurtransferase [Gammaproteobacteria bacterium]
MNDFRTEFLIEPAALEARLADPDLQIVDVCKAEQYAQAHIPDAVHVHYAQLVFSRPPVAGLLPDAAYMSALFSSLGLRPEARIVAYDDEGGGHAARLLWSLAAYGHRRYALLNGGLHAWANEGHPLQREPVIPKVSDYRASGSGQVVAERDYIEAHLRDNDKRLLDSRTPKEYAGEDKRAARAGHIPGAVNMDWTQTMDTRRNLRLKPPEALLARFKELGVTPEREIITYCQTHHRSAHTWLVLKALGFERVRGYPGSWSDWGNQPDTPVE